MNLPALVAALAAAVCGVLFLAAFTVLSALTYTILP